VDWASRCLEDSFKLLIDADVPSHSRESAVELSFIKLLLMIDLMSGFATDRCIS